MAFLTSFENHDAIAIVIDETKWRGYIVEFGSEIKTDLQRKQVMFVFIRMEKNVHIHSIKKK